MNLEIVSVHGQGDQEKEHVLLRVKSDCSVGHFLLADSTYTNDTHVSNKVRHTYWFPDKNVKADEYVSLWTKNGTSTSDTMKDGTPIHRFFWNLGKPVWNDSGDCAILFDLSLIHI